MTCPIHGTAVVRALASAALGCRRSWHPDSKSTTRPDGPLLQTRCARDSGRGLPASLVSKGYVRPVWSGKAEPGSSWTPRLRS